MQFSSSSTYLSISSSTTSFTISFGAPPISDLISDFTMGSFESLESFLLLLPRPSFVSLLERRLCGEGVREREGRSRGDLEGERSPRCRRCRPLPDSLAGLFVRLLQTCVADQYWLHHVTSSFVDDLLDDIAYWMTLPTRHYA
jgi:hypothetical protein